MSRSQLLFATLLACAFAVAGFFFHQADYPLTYDEGDYYIAVQRGLWTNWTDNDDLSILQFGRMGVEALGDPKARARLSDYIRESGSTMFLRHYHPPLAFYPAIATSAILPNAPLQWRLRAANLFWILLWIAILAALAYRWEDARTPMVLLVPASAAYGMAVVGFNMHLPFGLLVSLFLYCLYLYERNGEPAQLWLARLFFAAALVTVAYGMFLSFFTAVLLLWRFLRSKDRRGFLRRVLKSAGWVALFVLLLWPAAIINLNLLKNWIFTLYIALFRLSDEAAVYGNWVDLLFEKWNASPPELLLLLALMVFLVFRLRLLLRYGSLFLAAGMILALLYLQLNPALVYRWYLFPVFAIAFLFLADVASREPGWNLLRRPEFVAGAAVVVFIIALITVGKPDYSELIALHRIVGANAPTAMTMPRSVYPQLRPYFPDAAMTTFHDVAYADMEVADSVAVWRERGFVIVPRTVVPIGMTHDFETENYLLFRATRK